jgi:hypothetical protein
MLDTEPRRECTVKMREARDRLCGELITARDALKSQRTAPNLQGAKRPGGVEREPSVPTDAVATGLLEDELIRICGSRGRASHLTRIRRTFVFKGEHFFVYHVGNGQRSPKPHEDPPIRYVFTRIAGGALRG